MEDLTRLCHICVLYFCFFYVKQSDTPFLCFHLSGIPEKLLSIRLLSEKLYHALLCHFRVMQFLLPSIKGLQILRPFHNQQAIYLFPSLKQRAKQPTRQTPATKPWPPRIKCQPNRSKTAIDPRPCRPTCELKSTNQVPLGT